MQARLPILLLPGMHGTDALYGPFAERLAPGLAPRAVAYPATLGLTYEQYVDTVPIPDGPFGVVAESFSGPVGVLLAARHGQRVRGLVLVSTFVRAPAMARLAAMAPASLFRAEPPPFALRAGLLGPDASLHEVMVLRDVLRRIAPELIAERLRLVAGVDVTQALAGCSAPLLHLEAARDRLLSGADARAIRLARPDCAHVRLAAPHLLLQRMPEEAAARVSAHFLG